MEKGKIIAVIGAPRSGKTFLVNRLAEKLGYEAILEGVDGEVPQFLADDIKNGTHALRRIYWFRNSQVNNFLKACALRDAGNGVVVDTFWVVNQLYIDVLLKGHDAEVARETAHLDFRTLPWPDVIVYLRNSAERTREFLTAGGRAFDADEHFYRDTIQPLQEKYEEILTHVPPTTKLVTVQRDDRDFDRAEDLTTLIDMMGA